MYIRVMEYISNYHTSRLIGFEKVSAALNNPKARMANSLSNQIESDSTKNSLISLRRWSNLGPADGARGHHIWIERWQHAVTRLLARWTSLRYKTGAAATTESMPTQWPQCHGTSAQSSFASQQMTQSGGSSPAALRATSSSSSLAR